MFIYVEIEIGSRQRLLSNKMNKKKIRLTFFFHFTNFIIFTISQLFFFSLWWTAALVPYNISIPDIVNSSYPFMFWVNWIGIVFMFISEIHLYYLKLHKSLIYGFIGNSIIGFVVFQAVGLVFYLLNHFLVPLYLFSGLILFFYSLLFQIDTFLASRKISELEKISVKKTILDLGTQFTRLEVREVSEECKVDQDTVIKIIIEMIKYQEIYAEYFASSRTVAFNLQVNIEKIDELMGAYKDWEEMKGNKIKI